MVVSMYSFRNDFLSFPEYVLIAKRSAVVLLWNSFQSDEACEKKKRLYSYAMHSNTVLLIHIALHCVLCADAVLELLTKVCTWISDLCAYFWIRRRYCWRCEVQQQRSIGTSVKECCDRRFGVCMDFGLYIARQNLLRYVLRLIIGGKIQIRVEPDLIWG